MTPPSGPPAPEVIPNPTWPWIARLALELGAHPPELIERALTEQAAHPQQALDAFLEFEQEDRERVLQELKENPARFTAEVEEQALLRLEASDEPAPGTNAPTAALTCSACRIQVELPAPLLPFVPNCPACGAEVPRLPPPTPPPPDLDPKLAHPWMLDEALARWAIAFGGATADQVAQARTESEIGSLCEVLVVRCGLSLEAVMEVMADEVDVRCTGCSAEYAVGVRLHRCLDAMECPLCAAELTSTESTIVRRREIESEDQTCVTSRAGPYLLIRRLGYGGMSDVYLGEGPEGPQVAVKILSALLRGEVSRERFAREAELLKTLEHPNVIRTLDFGVGEATARPYIALELVRGRDLLAILRDREEKHLTPDEVVFVLERCAQALQYAHEQGVIHRDVKPGNLLVDPESNEVKLTDFGIALRMDEASRLTVDSEVLGTPMYLSPEVIMTGDWTPAADLYALGALGWRLLTGGSFVTAGEAFSREARRVPTEDELHSAAPASPSQLNRLVLALLASEPTERPTVADVLATLTPLLPPIEALQALFRESALEPEEGPTHANAASLPASLSEGQAFDKYVIEEEIGRGGMGAVYRAYHPQLEQRVALKLLVPDALESEAQRVRFLREAQAASALKHPAIVPVLDAGEHDGTCYLVMDLVDGRSLSALIRDATPPPREQLLRLFVRMCEGVHHAHLRGVIHRDLKPDNVMVDREGEPRLLDFGMAKKIDQKDEHDVTTEGDIVGTIRYMPPEQGAGNQAEVDVRSDVYALGSILYQLACGRTPFEGTLREILHQLHFDAAKPPSAYRADVPWELDAICLKALEKQKPDRYQSADALRADVLRFLEGQPIAARRSTAAYRIRKWLARNPLPAAVGAAVLLVIAALGSGWYATGQRAVAEHQQMILDPVRDALTQLEQGDHQGAVDKLKAARELLRPSDQITLPAEVLAHLPPEARASLPDAPRLTAERLGSWIALGLRRRNVARGQTLSARGNAQLESASAEHLTPADRRRRLLEAKRLLAEAQRLDRQNPAILRLLTRTHEELGKLAELEASIAVRKATLARAHRLVRNAAEALATGNAQQARTLYIQALAFDGRNESAQSGLVQADRISRKQAEAQEAAERKAQAEAFLNEGKSIRAQAQVAYRKGDLPERVRQRYFHAVESLQRALYLLPKHPGCTAELHALAREFAAVLVEQGYPELAGFMRRIGGVDPHDDFRRSLPRDPHLVLLEADAVVIRRAFGGVVRFQSTTALDSLRRWIESQKVRWRFRIEVRSHVVPGLHPQVYTTGLRIRLEDPAAGTRTAWTEVAFKERYLRPVVVDSQGRRLVRSFDRAHRFDGAAVIKQVERIVQGMVQRAKGSR